MSGATQVLPSASVTELVAAAAFAATGIPDLPVFMGPAGGTYPVNTPVLFNAGDIVTLQSIFPNGQAVKECAAAVVDVAQPFAFMRMTAASVATLVTTPVVVQGGSSTWLYALSGTALDGADVVVKFGTVGGPTGTGPIAYSVSLNGGVTFGSTLALGTATTIVVIGVTITLGSGKVVTTGDTAAWTQWPPSATVLPLTTSGAGSGGTYQGSSVITATGTALDYYEVVFRVANDGSGGTGTTVGTLGTSGPIMIQYALDGLSASPTWSNPQSLALLSSFLLLDGPISSATTGITLAFASGTLYTGDTVTFRTSPPTYNAAGLTAACAALASAFNGGTLTWTWVRAVGPVPEAIAADADAIALAWEGGGVTGCQPSWFVLDALDRAGTTQTDLGWSAYLQAQYAPYTSTHVGVAAGMLRGFDPINGRLNRRSNFAWAMSRAMGALGTNISTDWAEFDLGPMQASVTGIDATGNYNEHDANINPSLNAMGFITSRHWPGETGVFPTKAALLGPANDIQRVPLRRVMNLVKKLLRRSLKLNCVKTFRQWTSQSGPLKTPNAQEFPPGNIFEVDAVKIEQAINDVLAAGVVTPGYVSACDFVLNRMPTALGGGSYEINGAEQTVALLYVDVANATAQYVSASG